MLAVKKENEKSLFTEEIEKHKLYHQPVTKLKMKSERNSKVKILTEKEIRQEEGLGAKPFGTLNENIIWTVKEFGPVTQRKVYEYLCQQLGNPNKATIGTSLNQLSMLPYVIKGEKVEAGDRRKTWSIPLDKSVEEVKSDLYKALGEVRKARKLRKDGSFVAIPKSQEPPEMAQGWIEASPPSQSSQESTSSDLIKAFAEVLQKLFDGVTIEIKFKKQEK